MKGRRILTAEERFTYDQIAQILDGPSETVRYRVRKARGRLVRILPPDLANTVI